MRARDQYKRVPPAGTRALGWFWIGHWPHRLSGGFVLSYRWFALGVGFGRCVWRWFRLILSLVLVRVSFGRSVWRRFRFIISLVRVRVSFGRYVWRRLRLILSFVRVRCRFWTFLLAVVSSYPLVGSP